MFVVTLTLWMVAPAATDTVLVTVGVPEAEIATGVELVTVVIAVVGAAGSVETSRSQLLSEPPSRLLSSEIVSVHVPLGFSPRNAASGSSGASGEAKTRLT